MAITIVGQRLMLRNDVLRILLRPIEPFLFICVILQLEHEVFFAAAREDVNMTGSIGIVWTDGSRFAQNVPPEHLIELPVAEMIRTG